MDKKFRKTFFLICLGGGGVFAVAFFLIYGAAVGYSLVLALLCLGGGLFFALAFYFVWILLEKFEKPFSFENPKAQKKLLDEEMRCNTGFEQKFCAYMNRGKGLRQAVCETCIYFEPEKIHIAYCYFGKIYKFDIPYATIGRTFISGSLLVVESSAAESVAFAVKDELPRLRKLLLEKGLYRDGSSLSTGKLFITEEERSGTCYMELQYADGDSDDGTSEFWHKDSLYVHIDDLDTFAENYDDCFTFEKALDYYNSNFFTAKQTAVLLERVRLRAPQENSVIIPWLEKAVAEERGIYVLGF